jgi:hypothetical protein
MAKVEREDGKIDLVHFRRKYLPVAMQFIDLGKGHLWAAIKHAINDYRAGRDWCAWDEYRQLFSARVPPSRYYIAPDREGKWVVVLQYGRGNKHVTVALDGDSGKYPWLNDLFEPGCQRGNLYVSRPYGEWTIGVDLFYNDRLRSAVADETKGDRNQPDVRVDNSDTPQ